MWGANPMSLSWGNSRASLFKLCHHEGLKVWTWDCKTIGHNKRFLDACIAIKILFNIKCRIPTVFLTASSCVTWCVFTLALFINVQCASHIWWLLKTFLLRFKTVVCYELQCFYHKHRFFCFYRNSGLIMENKYFLIMIPWHVCINLVSM